MPSSSILHSRTRALLFISICLALIAFVSLWASHQLASAASGVGQITPYASTITVNSTADVANSSDGLCTLREAITAANTDTASGVALGECGAGNSGVDDTINLSVTGTISLAGVLPDITTNMGISGPGSSQLTVKRDTGGDYRIFNVAATVAISGLTVTNGKTPDGVSGTNGTSGDSGGGIMNAGTLIMTDIVLTANHTGDGGAGSNVGGDGGKGAAVLNSGTLTMTSCAVTANVTGKGGAGSTKGGNGGDGGAISNSGNLTITNSTVNGNTTGNASDSISMGGTGGRGGAIYCDGGVMNLTSTTFNDNITGDCPGGTAANQGGGGRGGGFYLAAGSVTLTNSSIKGNRTGVNRFGSTGNGGGIENAATILTILGSTISENTGNAAGAIFNRSQLIITNSTVSGNHNPSSTPTGILSVESFSSLRVTNCTITLNDGSGIEAENPATVRNTIIAGNFSSFNIDVGGHFTSQGHNLIGKSFSGSGFTNGSNGDQVGTSGSPINSQLGPLANNGGPTQTHALLSTSPALDAGDDCVTQVAHCGDANIPQLTTDQRGPGFNRLGDGPDADTIATVDIGAYEKLPVNEAPSFTKGANQTVNEDAGAQTVANWATSISPGTNESGQTVSFTATNDNNALFSVQPGISSAGTLTYTPAANASGTTTVTVTLQDNGGTSNGGVDTSAPQTFTISVNAINDPPSFTKGPNQTVNEDAGAQTFNNWATNISAGAANESGQALTFQVTGNNAALFAVAPAISSTGTLTYTPAADANGSATITISLMDNGGTLSGGVDTSASQTFTITVNAVNDAPSFTKGANQTVNEDSGAQTVANWATSISPGPVESSQTVSFTASNDNNALFSAQPAIGSTGTLTYTPVANANGATTVTVTLKDNGGTSNGGVDTSPPQTFTITVNAINDPPSFTKGANQTVNEDAGAQTVANWATSILAGPTDESGQTLAFQVTGNSNPALFSSAPAISSAGTLTYTPAADANGPATITFNLMDNGGTANGGVDTSASQTFTITVNSVNDAPLFTKGPNQTVNEDAGAQTVANWATGISPGPVESSQTVSFTASNNNNALFSSQPAINSTGTLTYTPAANANGTTTVSVTLKDNGGTSNGGVDTSLPQTFTITVNAVNDAPSFTKGSDQFVNNNTGAQTVDSWATNILPGPGNESSQTVTFQITNNTNAGLFAAGPAISSTGTLTYTPVATANGVATITIVLTDDGGTANGGVNTSLPQTFNITVNSSSGSVGFSSTTYGTTESSGFTTITVKRTGDMSRAVNVDYATSGDTGVPCSTPGAASPKCDFTSALGTVKFAIGEDTKTFTVLISQDSFVEGSEPFTVTLLNPAGGGGVLGTPSTATVTIADDVSEPPTNPIDDASNYVRQQYHDFLNREPDAAGLAFWTNEINACGPDQACIDLKRINVSAAFFLSIEFQGTGYLVEREYKAAYGDTTGQSTFNGAHQLQVPIVRFNEFLPDTQAIGQGIVVGQPGWEAALENNKQAFAVEFVQRFRFTTAFPVFRTPAQFVDQLNANAGNVLSSQERANAIALFGSDTNITNVTARARALRQVAEDPDLYSAELNRAFVLMQYFGYLRRNPNDPQDPDYSGYEFWFTKLNQFNGNFVNSDMVKAFITSGEYRQRFGP